jgi:hypothetical protein
LLHDIRLLIIAEVIRKVDFKDLISFSFLKHQLLSFTLKQISIKQTKVNQQALSYYPFNNKDERIGQSPKFIGQ